MYIHTHVYMYVYIYIYSSKQGWGHPVISRAAPRHTTGLRPGA